jgi:hypothetical protein
VIDASKMNQANKPVSNALRTRSGAAP